MIYGKLPVSPRRVYLLRDNFTDYRKTRLAELARVREDFEQIMAEEHALLEWSRHHLDELIRRFKERGPAVMKPRQKRPR